LPYLEKRSSQTLKRHFKFVKAGEYFYISAIEGNYKDSGYKKSSTGDEVFLHYYLLADLMAILSSTSLKIIFQTTISVADNPSKDKDLIIIATRKNG
jgi:hypothetical protein